MVLLEEEHVNGRCCIGHFDKGYYSCFLQIRKNFSHNFFKYVFFTLLPHFMEL